MKQQKLKKQLSGVMAASIVIGSVDIGTLYAQASALQGQENEHAENPIVITEETLDSSVEETLDFSTEKTIVEQQSIDLGLLDSLPENSQRIYGWDFNDGINGWTYGSGWDSTTTTTIEADQGGLKVNVDYSNDTTSTWNQRTVIYQSADGLDFSNAESLTFDLIYNENAKTTGSFKGQFYVSESFKGYIDIDTTNAVSLGDGYYKTSASFTLNPVAATNVQMFALQVIGNQTDYKGDLWIDNVQVFKSTEQQEDIYVHSTISATGGAAQSTLNGNKLETAVDSIDLSTHLTIVDDKADANTKSLYAYLEAMGKSKSVIYGHQNDTWHKAGLGSTNSDTKDVTGSISGIVGIDTLSLTGNEYSAKRYNEENGGNLPETAEGHVQAAALITNQAINDGAIITLSAHMPNFSTVQQTDPSAAKTYAQYDFMGASFNNLSGDTVNEILPGGKYHEIYNAYLDMIADYASQVEGSILFRPFHENTGNWFWWGAAFCDAETYKNVYRYTVEYLRDEKDIHNLIYVYGPSCEASNLDEYSERYPGDEYVDMVGFDMYDIDPSENGVWMKNFETQLTLVQTFAEQHGKLFAVTETGVATSQPDKGDNQTALHKTGNKNKNWYNDVLDIVSNSNASYFLLWANFSQNDGFYTPYMLEKNEDGSLYGHEMLDNFIDFYNQDNTVFAINQKSVLEQIKTKNFTVHPTNEEATGYFVSPISGRRLLEATTLKARITGEASEVKFILNGKSTSEELIAVQGEDDNYYEALLDEETLKALGEHVGTIDLIINGQVVQSINMTFNIPEPVLDVYQVDGFENYHGVDSMLTKSWATNKESGNTIKLSLTNEEGKFYKGNYGLKFEYMELENGWAGATIAKEVDWSEQNALQFWTIPDGNNQKVVVQLTANGIVYEVHLNLYDEYKNSTEPMLVTIPFSEFFERDTEGNPKGSLVNNSHSISSFGLWVNAINNDAMIDGKVEGTIYYDEITAIKTDSTVPIFDTNYDNDTPNPDTPNPDTSNPDTSNPDTSKPDTSRPDTSNPNTSNPNTSNPDTSNPDTSNPNTPTTGLFTAGSIGIFGSLLTVLGLDQFRRSRNKK